MSRHAVVTGDAGGVGSAICELLVALGWRVTGIDRNPAPSGTTWTHFDADLAVRGEAILAAGKARQLEPVTALVHAAADQRFGAAGSLDEEAWELTFRTNLFAIDLLVHACKEDLRQANGSIVAISSVHADATTRDMAAYAASKAALQGWARAAALDLAPEIRVNVVQPGAIDTAMLWDGLARRSSDLDERAALDELAARTPLDRIGSASEIAEVVAFLLSDRSRFITGSVVRVDGGALAQLPTE